MFSNFSLSEPTEEDISNVTGTVGLGCISPQHVAFQVDTWQSIKHF